MPLPIATPKAEHLEVTILHEKVPTHIICSKDNRSAWVMYSVSREGKLKKLCTGANPIELERKVFGETPNHK